MSSTAQGNCRGTTPRGSYIILSAILTQYTDTPEETYGIAVASRALSSVEQRYPQTDREGLVVEWACEHFHLYIYGLPVTVVIDHKPLVFLFNSPKSKLPVRPERYTLRLEVYHVNVAYTPGTSNPADYLSRQPVPCSGSSHERADSGDHYVNFVAAHAEPKAMFLKEINSVKLEDVTLQRGRNSC